MSEQEQEPTPRPRLRSVSPDERPEQILPGLPRVAALDALLREVDGLRLTLETDLSMAADAVEAGKPALAADILGDDRSHLAAFETRALGHLADLSEPVPAAARRRRFRIPAAPFVAAAAVVGFVLSIAPQVGQPATSELSATAASANGALDRLQAAALEGDTSEVRATAQALHLQLMAAVEDAATDPAAAKVALLLLSYERNAIVASGDSAALHDVLAQSTALANRIRAALPAPVRSTVPVAPQLSPSPAPAAKPSPTKAPSPSPTASPAAKPSATPSPTPTASASSSASPTSGPIVPGAGGDSPIH